MRQSDRQAIETTANDCINKMVAAQSATNETNNGVSRGLVAADLRPLTDRVKATHQDAVIAAQKLVAAVAIGGVESISQAAQEVLASVESAKAAADQFVGTPTQEQADSTRKVDEESLARLTHFKTTFHSVPELESISGPRFTHLLGPFTSLTASQAIGLLAGGAIFVVAAIGLIVLGLGILQTKDIVDKLAVAGYARGLITYILAIGTVAIALVLVVSALLGTDASKDNFDRGKEILTVLIGIFGTILGFYFGSNPQAGAVPTPSPSPVASVSPAASVSPTASAPPAAGAPPAASVSP